MKSAACGTRREGDDQGASDFCIQCSQPLEILAIKFRLTGAEIILACSICHPQTPHTGTNASDLKATSDFQFLRQMADIREGDGSPDRLLIETNDRLGTSFLDMMNFTDRI